MNGFVDSILGYRESAGPLSIESVILCLLATFLMGQVVAWVYVRTHRGISYTGSLVRSLVILALIVALVMTVVGNNIARAFGLFGALALIRFRTPVKDANDTVYLFLAVAIGIATGTGNIVAGAVGTLLICLALLYLSWARFGTKLNHDALIRFHVPVGGRRESSVVTILDRYCEAFNLLHMREAETGATLEFSYQVKMIDTRDSAQLVSEIEELPDVRNLSLLMQDSEATP